MGDPEKSTMLVKIVGMFSIEVRNGHGAQEKQDFIVMEKMFQGCVPTRIFDLKGSVRNRLKADSAAVSFFIFEREFLLFGLTLCLLQGAARREFAPDDVESSSCGG